MDGETVGLTSYGMPVVVIRLTVDGKREAPAPVRTERNAGRQGGVSKTTVARASTTKATVLHTTFIVRSSAEAKTDIAAKEITQQSGKQATKGE